MKSPANAYERSGATFMRKIKGPSLRDMIIPLGMGGGAAVGFLVAVLMTGGSNSEARIPDDPGDAAAMFGVFFAFGGAVIGTLIGVIAAVTLSIKRRRELRVR
jgi:hypothetical protein